MIPFIYTYLLWHLEARGLVTTGQKLSALIVLLLLLIGGLSINGMMNKELWK